MCVTMSPRPRLIYTVTIFTLLMMLPLVAASSTTIQYTLDSSGLDARLGAFGLFLRGSHSPHYTYYDIVENNTDYHVLFVRMFEYTDSNHDGVYTQSADTPIGPVISLQSGIWVFSNFVTQEESGDVVKLDFQLTSLSGTFYPQQPELQLTLVNHLNVSNNASLKFDIILSGWEWHNSNNSLALGIVLSMGQHSTGQMNRPTVHPGSGNVSFGNGYLLYPSVAQVDSKNVGVNVSVNGANPQNNGEQVYFCFPYFSDTLEYDPTIGLFDISSVTTTQPSTPPGQPPLFDIPRIAVIGIGVTVVIVIAVKFQSDHH
ncbi:MAG: exported protein of unknown function [Candidatus Thorarchaeota archaeon]|nr:MAG: exported protein of unknown function [Candidatus Thorarchaeota archaeon]